MEKYTYALGRRKTSVATIRLFEGKGESLLNRKPLNSVVISKYDRGFLLQPLKLIEKVDNFYFTAMVKGGGKSSQLQAIKHALSRALAKFDKNFRPVLKKAKLLTRDDRMVERKKTGLRKARKAPQYSKR